jgi:transcription elongation factor GreB
VSKAFTSEETIDDPLIVRARAPLPAGVPNYVTARGLSLLREELGALERERAVLDASLDEGRHARLAPLNSRIGELSARIGGAVVVDGSSPAADEVRFGATVVVRDASGERRRYEIVGVDEANARDGRLAFVAPLARALLGRRVGELASVQTPRGEEELEVVEISYGS